jgi:hypothetical protein
MINRKSPWPNFSNSSRDARDDSDVGSRKPPGGRLLTTGIPKIAVPTMTSNATAMMRRGAARANVAIACSTPGARDRGEATKGGSVDLFRRRMTCPFILRTGVMESAMSTTLAQHAAHDTSSRLPVFGVEERRVVQGHSQARHRFVAAVIVVRIRRSKPPKSPRLGSYLVDRGGGAQKLVIRIVADALGEHSIVLTSPPTQLGARNAQRRSSASTRSKRSERLKDQARG